MGNKDRTGNAEKNKVLQYVFGIIAVVIFFECFVFNYHFWFSKDYELREVNLTELSAVMEDSAFLSDNGKLVVTNCGEGLISADYLAYLAGIDIRDLKNFGITGYVYDNTDIWYDSLGEEIYAEITSNVLTASCYEYSLQDNTLELSSHKNLLFNQNTVSYMNLQYSDDKSIFISLCPKVGSMIVIEHFYVNVPVQFHFSILRTGLFLGLFALIYMLWFSGKQNVKIACDNYLFCKYRKLIMGGCVGLFFLMGLLLILINPVNYGNAGFCPHGKLAESFAKGILYIDEEPPVSLLELDNPYDVEARKELDEPILFDYAFYEGRYYVYFGVLPCVLFYLPYYLITGETLCNTVVILIGLLVLLCSWAVMLDSLVKRFFPELSVKQVVLAYCFLNFASGYILMTGNINFYFIPMLYSLVLIVLGACFWISAVKPGEQGEEYFSNHYVLLGSVMFALVLACRPQLVLTAILALPLLMRGMLSAKMLSRLGMKPIHNPHKLKNWMCFFLPYFVVAIPLMIYNQLRFGSPFEFGAKYNLTSFNVCENLFYPDKIWDGIHYYLIQIPRLSKEFPFLCLQNFTATAKHNIFVSAGLGGLLFINPLLFLLLFNKRKNMIEDRKIESRHIELLAMKILLGILGVFFLIFATMMGGLIYRYIFDFSMLGAILVVIHWMERCRNGISRKWENIYNIIFLWMVFVNCAGYFLVGLWPLADAAPELETMIANLIMFWK